MNGKNAVKSPANNLLKKKNYDKIKTEKIKEAEETNTPKEILGSLEFDYPNVLRGLVYSEILGKPKALRKFGR